MEPPLDIRGAIEHLVKTHSTLVLSTVAPEGQPRATPLFYLPGSRLELYWFSNSESAHSQDLEKTGKASIAIYRPTERWDEICGVQMRGKVGKMIDHARRTLIEGAYWERFRLDDRFQSVLARSSLYFFQPAWIRYLDNSRHFGFKFEITVAEDGAAEGSGIAS